MKNLFLLLIILCGQPLLLLSGGTAMHYFCDEKNEWQSDIRNIESLITKNTKAMVVINPNNPTGAVYSKEILETLVSLCVKNNILIFSDEIYEKIIFDNVPMYNMATLTGDYSCVFFSGLSKAYRVPGFRCGWLCFKDPYKQVERYRAGLDILSSMRLCSNVQTQYAVQASLIDDQSINALIEQNGRPYKQREHICSLLENIPGMSFLKPKGALYVFPKIDTQRLAIHDDEKFILGFLKAKHILMVHGRAFHWNRPDHFRIVILLSIEDLEYVRAYCISRFFGRLYSVFVNTMAFLVFRLI